MTCGAFYGDVVAEIRVKNVYVAIDMWVNKYDVSIDMWAKQYDVAIDMWASLVHVRHIRTHIQQSKQFNIFYYSNTTDIGKSSEEYS
jgi:hypothetical protein